MNWDDPAERFRLLDRVGPDAYNAAFEAYRKSITLTVINGYEIIPVTTQFGRLFQVMNTQKAFRTQREAEDFAAQQPTRTTP